MILDVGCGKRKRGDVGIDYAKDSEADIIADAQHLPFRNKVFQKTVSYCVLEHSPNPLNFLKEQHRVLQENGQLELVTDNAQYFRWSVMQYRGDWHEEWHKDHFMIFFPKNVERLMALANFKNVSSNYIPFRQTKFGLVIKFLIRLGLLRSACQYRTFKITALK
jgi:ubiquinone/menaquinone biosynthesis C-methylase UbiE